MIDTAHENNYKPNFLVLCRLVKPCDAVEQRNQSANTTLVCTLRERLKHAYCTESIKLMLNIMTLSHVSD